MQEELTAKLNKIYNSNIPEKIKDRIKLEYSIIGEERINILIKIVQVLNKNFKDQYSISGSINSFYLSYLLNIISFNPLDYNIETNKQFFISINIIENNREKLFDLLNKKFKGLIKKISNESNSLSKYYNGIVFDKNNALSCFKTGIVKAKKKDIIHKYFIINIYEKEILTLLDKMAYGNREIGAIFSDTYLTKLKNKMAHSLKHQTPFESIIQNISSINLEDLINKHICFSISHLDQLILEYRLTFFKYNMPRTYYINYLEYLKDKVDIKIINKYKDNFTLFFKENTDELTINYKFYALWYDALKYVEDLKIIINASKVKICYQNIKFIETVSLNDKFKKINEIIDNYEYKEIDIFGLEGNSEYYLSNIIASKLSVFPFRVRSYLNPLGGDKVFFDKINYQKIPETKYLELINHYRNLPIFLITDNYDTLDILDNILNCSECGTEIILIDDYEELIKQTKYKQILKILNKLNKEIYIFNKIKEGRK